VSNTLRGRLAAAGHEALYPSTHASASILADRQRVDALQQCPRSHQASAESIPRELPVALAAGDALREH
jgi:hypothetical protein